ncbi:hypothetical protein D3C86_1844280 [compost metagenome]
MNRMEGEKTSSTSGAVSPSTDARRLISSIGSGVLLSGSTLKNSAHFRTLMPFSAQKRATNDSLDSYGRRFPGHQFTDG